MGVGVQRHAPVALPPEKRPGTHFKPGCVGTTSGVDGHRKFRLHRYSIPGPYNP